MTPENTGISFTLFIVGLMLLTVLLEASSATWATRLQRAVARTRQRVAPVASRLAFYGLLALLTTVLVTAAQAHMQGDAPMIRLVSMATR